MDERERLLAEVADTDLVRYFYLDLPTERILDKLETLELKLTTSQDTVPFNAQVKGYFGAVDGDGDPWILKPAPEAREVLYHRICTLAFLLDHRMGTLSAPTAVFTIEGKQYRATKVVRNAMQISSYNYLESPFIEALRADLVNRWLYFDEDRNPNNYLVIHNKANRPFIVAIDFDKADFESDQMKITGTPDKFGWIRGEKTRFLTLLRPDNFEGVSIEAFEARLAAMMSIRIEVVKAAALRLVNGYCEDGNAMAASLAANFEGRKIYINEYFRRMFKSQAETKSVSNADDYSMFGDSFLAMYKNKN